MLQEIRDRKAAHFAGSVADGASVIDDDIGAVRGAGVSEPRAATDKNHRVKGRVLLKLSVKKQIAGASGVDVT